MSEQFENVLSLIKWTGSKRTQAKYIQEYFPKDFDRYLEPFLGGGSMLYNNSQKLSFGNDLYKVLIDLRILVQQDPEDVKRSYLFNWTSLQSDFPDYYTVRARFNHEQNPNDLLFLSRTSVNGIIRFNSKGEFNNSLHLSRRGMEPKRFNRIVEKWHEKIKFTRFSSMDYVELLDISMKGDFVYLDPPYLGSTNRYIKNIEIDVLIEQLDELNKKGVAWALSFDSLNEKNKYDNKIPKEIFKRAIDIDLGNSKLSQVLNKQSELTNDTLYLNY